MIKKIKYSFLILLLFTFLSCNICENRLVKTDNIDEFYKVVLFTRDAGATTSESLHLSIVPKGKELENKSGNICISDDLLEYKIENNIVIVFYTGNLYKSIGKYKNYLIVHVNKNS